MAKSKRVNGSEIKAAIAAVMNRKGPDIAQLRLAERARLMALRGKLAKQLEPSFAVAGLDIAKINKILTEHQSEVRSVLEKEKSESAKTFAVLNENLLRGIENRRKAVEQLAYKPLTTTPIPLWTAFEIVGPHQNIPFASHIEASNNWAVLSFDKGSDGHDRLDVYFWFYWWNPSQQPAVLNADSDLVLQGLCQTDANPGFLGGGGMGYVDLGVQLIIHAGGAILNHPPTQIREVESLGSGFPPETDPKRVPISGTYHLSYRNIGVGAGELVLFSVHFIADYSISGGLVNLDFETAGFIKCPGVQLELLTPPPVAVA